jgi:hypothetical protein
VAAGLSDTDFSPAVTPPTAITEKSTIKAASGTNFITSSNEYGTRT